MIGLMICTKAASSLRV